MKIGIRASSKAKQGYGRWGENTYKKLKEHGFNCTDFSLMSTDSIYFNSEEAVAISLLEEERELALEAGIEIAQVHGPWDWPLKDDTLEERNNRMENMKKSIYFASVLGSKKWVIHPIMPYGVNDRNTENAIKTREINISFFKELLETAKKYGITICLENMPFLNFSISTPEEILSIVNEIDDENFKYVLIPDMLLLFVS